MAFDDHAEVVSVERGLRICLPAPEDVLYMFKVGSRIQARLVWVNPHEAPLDGEAD
ncbi:hypothetical protein JOF56_010638 [Kibdelosporangium banguiense]|uniref:PilZ domain-containing protein n=1 Tax=Kibdelosporangium banguiense TaxID=1365924 RepID=A0ABS4U0S4_9PSEU|nr:hypothetical protein [Kibdelosporangium banguiense]MBP2330253.1 hypothetical protein [Kibdelosporangium banguiense]